MQSTRLKIDWFRPKGADENNNEWFLRIRSNSEGQYEVSYKEVTELLDTVRKCKEITFFTKNNEKLKDLFLAIGLENYAYQEKDRTSYQYKDWRFDIDSYPNMPSFIEVEGTSEEHVKEGVKLLGLESNKTWNDGERTLIQKVYSLDWYNMRF